MTGPRVGVVGGGLAGIAAGLRAADAGASVVLFERRTTLGGLTTSTRRRGLWHDNGQHVFMRCCTAYRDLLARIGGDGEVRLQPRLEVPVLSPSGTSASIRRSALPAPLHLARSLAAYRHLSVGERLALVGAVQALRRMDPEDPSLDGIAFGPWLESKGQSPRAIERLWNLIVLPTVNVPARDASLALAVKVFREGLLDRSDSGDVGWAAVPLVQLHGANGLRALEGGGVDVRLGSTVRAVAPANGGGVTVATTTGSAGFDTVIVAAPPTTAASFGVFSADAAARLGTSPIVNVNVVFDRCVTDLELFAAVESPIQFVFDRTTASGLERGQCLGLSISAADRELAIGSDELIAMTLDALGCLLPHVRRARVVDALVTRERAATFRGVPGTATLRPGPKSETPGVFLAGAWCATGWPATMEGAVRSGNRAARAALRWVDERVPAPKSHDLVESR